MLFKRLASAALATAVGIGAAGAAVAEDVTVSAEQLNALMQRLEQADKDPGAGTRKLPVSVSLILRCLSTKSRALQSFLAPETTATAMSLKRAADPKFSNGFQQLENQWVELNSDLENNYVRERQRARSRICRSKAEVHLDWAFPDTDAGAANFEGRGAGTMADPFVPPEPQDRFTTRRMRLGFKGDIRITCSTSLSWNSPVSTIPGSAIYIPVSRTCRG